MWFLVAIVVATVILAVILAPKTKTQDAKASALSDFNFPRSQEGDPVPRLYGTVKIKSPNTTYAGDFKAVAIKKKQKTGLFSSKRVTVGYKYYIGLDVCVCLGPSVKFRKLWLGKDLVWTGCLSSCVNTASINLPNLYGGQDKNGGIGGTVTFFCGDYNQPQSTYLVSKLGANVPAYVGFAHIVFHQFYWGNSPNIQPVYVEASHHSNSLGLFNCRHIMPNGLDANPIEVLYDLHVNKWGNLGINPNLIDIDNWRLVADTVWTEANGVSMLVSNPTIGGELAKEIMAQLNAMLYQDPSTGRIKIKLIRADYNVATLPVLGPGEISEVRNFSKILWHQTFNKVRVKFTNRAKDYARDAIAPAEDFANIRYQGKIRAADIKMPLCYDPALAAQLASRELSNVSVPLYKAELVCNREAIVLPPGEPFVWVWPEYGITGMVMRARKINLGKREDGRVHLVVVQDEFAASQVVTVPDPGDFTGESFPPVDVMDYLIWELPYWLEQTVATELNSRSGYYRLASFAKAPSASSISYHAYLDLGGATEDDVEALGNAPYSATAKLASPLAQYANWDTGTVPVVTIKELNQTSILKDGTVAGLREGAGLFVLNGELYGYETFTDIGGGLHQLENVRRALLDTTYLGGSTNDRMWFIDGSEGFFNTDVLPALQQVYFLDVTYTSVLDETLASRRATTPVRRKDLPLPPDGVTVDAARTLGLVINAGTSYTIAWTERSRLSVDIRFELDATQTPEAGTTYDVELRRLSDNSVVVSNLGVAATSTSLAVPTAVAAYDAVIQVWAVRSGSRSFTPGVYPVTVVSGDDRVTEDGGELRLTEDGGELRLTEGT